MRTAMGQTTGQGVDLGFYTHDTQRRIQRRINTACDLIMVKLGQAAHAQNKLLARFEGELRLLLAAIMTTEEDTPAS